MPQLVFDPSIPWDGPFPYTVLARLGITPQSTSAEILDASYTIVAEAATDQRLNDAWESLRLTPRRLLADFFCFELDEPALATPGERPSGVPWNLIETLDRLDSSVTLPLRPTAEPPMPPRLSATSTWREPGVHPRKDAP
jgi:hypothetical protein